MVWINQLVAHLSNSFVDHSVEFWLPLHSSLRGRDACLKNNLWFTCESSICRLSVAPVAQVRSASPDSISLALSDGYQHLEYQYINDGRKFDEIDAHWVTEKVTPIGCFKFNRLIKSTHWPGCSVTFSKVKWSVTFKDSFRSFPIWIVFQFQINTACWTIIKWLVRSSQFCRKLWLSRWKHSWWSPKWLWVWIIESWFTFLGT